MHADEVLQKCFADVFVRMHAARVQVLTGAIQALLNCRRLVLMDLARAWPQAERVSAPLKRLDRLLSNSHLHTESPDLYAHMSRWLIQGPRPVIVVDWSTLKHDESCHLLRAAVVARGRTVTVYEEVYPWGKQQSPLVHELFLNKLQQVLALPARCTPIIVTDAGFRCPWFRAVERLGWHWIGRVRNQVCFRHASSEWQLTRTLLSAQPRKLRVLGTVQLSRRVPLSCELLRYCQPSRARKHLTARGKIRRDKHSRESARGMREPWLLVYSSSLQALPPAQIVNHYHQRMQIELSFRDLKSERYGCAFNHSQTRSLPRIATLLLLHALASFVAWLVGLAAIVRKQTLHCEIRKSSQRARYSVVRLGWEAIRRAIQLPDDLLKSLRLSRPPTWLRLVLENGN